MKKTKSVFWLTCFFIFVWAFSALAQIDPQWEYQDRGDRYEGIKATPASEYTVELISALVNYEDKRRSSDFFKIKFYLEQPADVYLTVRERDPKHYYWMDNVVSPEPWIFGDYNTFEWPTETVIDQLEIEMAGLGALARLNNLGPSIIEEVSPVILYHSQGPDSIEEGYFFTFKISSDASLEYFMYQLKSFTLTEESFSKLSEEGVPAEIIADLKDLENREYAAEKKFLSDVEDAIGKNQTVQYRSQILKHADKQGGKILVDHQIFKLKRGGRPFAIRWDDSEAPEGSYQLALNGHFLYTNESIEQFVLFYHKPEIKE